jgi:hypothetical protein
MPHFKRARIIHPFEKSGNNFPNFYQRIKKNLLEGKPCLIIIDGKSQTGKSTLARYICKEYDPNYKLFFTVSDILEHLQFLKSKLEKTADGKLFLPKEYQNKWTFFDEPQLETPRQTFWAERNMILQAYTSAFGFLHNHLIMALPNIRGISDIILTNITFRISVVSHLKPDNSIMRKAYVKIPLFNDNKNKYFWVRVEDYTIPFIEKDLEYESKKTNNFFNVQLPKWEKEIGINTNRTIEEIMKEEQWKLKP